MDGTKVAGMAIAKQQAAPAKRLTPEDFGIPQQYANAARLYAIYMATRPQELAPPGFLCEFEAIHRGEAGWGR